MATLKEIRDQVQIDAGVLGNKDYPDARLNNLINQAQRFVQTELNGLGMKKWETSTALSLGASQQFAGVVVQQMDVPSDMLESPKSIIQMWVSDNGQAEGYASEVDQTNFVQSLLNTFMTPTIQQALYMRLDNVINIAPPEITSGTMYYYKRVAELSTDNAESEIPEEFIEYVIRRAVSQIEETLGKVNEAVEKKASLSKDISEAYEKFVGKMASQKTNEVLQ